MGAKSGTIVTSSIWKRDMDFKNRRQENMGKIDARYAHKKHYPDMLSCNNLIQSDAFNMIEVERQGAELQQSQQQLPSRAAISPNRRWPERRLALKH